ARSYAPRVRSEELGERVVEVAQALQEEGILNDVVEEDGHYRLRNVGCPYRVTAEGTHAACAADRRTIELLLGKPVQQSTQIVEGVDLIVRPGEIHALMGPNGSGKSTLASTIAGSPAYHVDGGQILFKGEDITKWRPDQRARAGMFLSFQYPTAIPGV